MRHPLALILVPAFAFAGDASALPVAVATDDAHILYSGRWDREDKAGPRCQWPAGTIRFNFEGTAANIVLSGKDNAFQVVIDGKPTSVITVADDQTVYQIAADLTAGRHAVELCKRTEGWPKPVQVKGIQLNNGAKLLDPPSFKRRVEFLGDSITCGYGNEAASQNEKFSLKTENAWLAWGAVAARALEAEYACEAVSGIWLMDNGKKKPLPAIWGNTMPFAGSKPWDFSKWQADVVVVNLGTNDFNGQPKGEAIDEQKWHDAYVGFIDQIRKAYPKAHIFLCIGSMGHGKKKEIPGYNTKTAEEYAAKGDKAVHAVAIANQDMKNGIGADWHPSVKTHQLMADQITAAIRKELGW